MGSSTETVIALRFSDDVPKLVLAALRDHADPETASRIPLLSSLTTDADREASYCVNPSLDKSDLVGVPLEQWAYIWQHLFTIYRRYAHDGIPSVALTHDNLGWHLTARIHTMDGPSSVVWRLSPLTAFAERRTSVGEGWRDFVGHLCYEYQADRPIMLWVGDEGLECDPEPNEWED